MLKEEVIELLEKEKAYMIGHGGDRQAEALDVAIKSVKQESVSREAYDHEYFLRKVHEVEIKKLRRSIRALEKIKELEKDSILDVLDKIKAKIEALPKTYPFVNHFDMYVKEDDVKRIINKYKNKDGE